MNQIAEEALQPLLESGERIVWADQPAQGLRFGVMDRALIPFSLLWAGLSIYLEYQVITETSSIAAALFGLPFVAIGLYLLVGRFFLDAALRARTFYGLSNRRIIIVNGLSRKYTRTLDLSEMPLPSLTETSARRGIISFGRTSDFTSTQNDKPLWFMLQRPVTRFESIENAGNVYDQIITFRKNAR